MSMPNEAATKADIESVVNLIQQLAERIDQRFEAVENHVNRRFEAVENRLDRISDTLAGVLSQMAAMTRWADRMDRDHSAVLATQTAQQRVIDDLAARVLRLEGQKPKSN
jgi:septal ring factor EnvC (AmiA/AmiB activator)